MSKADILLISRRRGKCVRISNFLQFANCSVSPLVVQLSLPDSMGILSSQEKKNLRYWDGMSSLPSASALGKKAGRRLTVSGPFEIPCLRDRFNSVTRFPTQKWMPGVLVLLNKLHMLSRGLAPSAANDTLSWEAPKQLCLLMAPCWHSTTAPSRRWRSQAPHSRRLAPLAPAARPLWNKERQCVSFFVAHYLEAMSIRTSYH